MNYIKNNSSHKVNLDQTNLEITKGFGAKPSKSKAMSHIARRVTVHTNPLLAIFKTQKMAKNHRF